MSNHPIPTLDRLIIVVGPPQSGKTLNAKVIGQHFECPVYEDLDMLARDYQFEDFTSAVLLCSSPPTAQHSGFGGDVDPRFVVKHARHYVYAREVRLESPDRLRGNVVGWVDPKPMEKI
jgi:hypothetical protein